MIKFFRQIRQTIIMENSKSTRYFKYAIGEIILVVIGILIALQINNWNEIRKEKNLAKNYLESIKIDLEKDIIQVDRIIEEHINSISIINSIDSTILQKQFHEPEKYKHFFKEADTTKIQYIFYRGYSFRPTNGAFNSLISDGKSGLIKNKSLFQNIQEIYTEINARLSSNYEHLKRIEHTTNWHYPKEKQSWTYAQLKKSKNDKIFLDLANFVEERYFYAINLSRLKDKMISTVKLLETEIQ